jgi:hypothetical protein
VDVSISLRPPRLLEPRNEVESNGALAMPILGLASYSMY